MSGRLHIIHRILSRVGHIHWALIDQAEVSGANFFSSVVLARILGIAEFGRFALAWTIVLFIQGIQHAAINTAMMSIGPKQDPLTASSYYGAVFLQQSVLAVCNALLVWIGVEVMAIFFPNWQLNEIAVPLAAVVLCCSSQEFLRRYFFTVGRPAISFASDAIRYLSQLAIFLILFWGVKSSVNTAMVLWIMTVTALVASLVVIPFIQRLQWSSSVFRSVSLHKWHFSKWLVGSALLFWATNNLFFVTSGMLLGTAAAGALRAVQNLIGVTHVLFSGMENVIPKEASQRFVTGGQRSLLVYLRQVTLVGGLATAMIVCVFAIMPSFWLQLFYGEQFMAYRHLVQWQAAIEMLAFLALPVHVWLQTVENTKIIFYAYVITAAVSTALAYPLIAYFGVTGAIAGIFISNVVYLAFLLLGIYAARKLR
jgi:O-antigen/teichoic acid export membrane protein